MQHCTTETPFERKRRLRNNKQIRKTNAEHYSQRCDFLNRMKVRRMSASRAKFTYPGRRVSEQGAAMRA